jgi:hypothetical protein
MRRLLFRAALGAALVLGCGASTQEHPFATLSTSPRAGHGFAQLRLAFEHDPHDARLAKRFREQIGRYPKDRTTNLVRLYLGHVLLDMKDVKGAQQELDAVPEPPDGNEHDFWLALKARLLRANHDSDAALALLQPLVGTVVDLPLRTILLEEVAVASIDAHRSLEAVAYLDGWLRSVPPHAHREAHDRVRAELARIEPSVLAQTLEAMQVEGGGGYSPELQRMVAESLAKHALEAQDTQLAQRLIASSLGKYLTGSTTGQDLRDLATSLRGAHAVVAHTIGLVLPIDSAELRDIAADAARGAAFALGLPRVRPSDDATRLVTRADESSKLEASLEEVAGGGASIVVAGFDEASAERACRWSEQNGLAVITLAAPKTPGHAFCFTAGEARSTSVGLLVSELEKRLASKKDEKVASVVGALAGPAMSRAKSASLDLLPPFVCDPPFSRARLPLDAWRKADVRAFLVSAPAGCVRTLLPALPRGAEVGLALESATGGDDVRGTARLHAFAVAPSVTPDVAAYEKAFGSAPRYWTSLGRDAVILAHAAEAGLPLDRTTSRGEISRRREMARAALASAHASLWTTEANGFARDHTLPRTLRVVDLH